MQVNSVNNFTTRGMNLGVNLPVSRSEKLAQNEVIFTGDDRKADKAIRNMMMALCFLPASASMMTSCDDEPAYAHAEVEVNGDAEVTIDGSDYEHPTDTIIKWYREYDRPQPLDSLMNNLQNWDIDDTDINMLDSTHNRNIIHYEGVREWEYNTREIGDMNVLESSKKVLVYDTEILDYKGNHEAYGKRVLRIPTVDFTIKTKDGKVLQSPKGLFVEEYQNDFDDKNASILDCTLKSRTFCQTNGDTLNVAKRKGTNEFVETGKVAKGYLGANSILLKNLIGEYPTDDHYVDFKIEAIPDKELRLKYVQEKDKENKE